VGVYFLKKAVVFDCDGTLISSMGVVHTVLAQSLTKVLGRSVTLSEVLEKFDAHLEIMFKRFNLTKTQEADMLKDWSEQTLPKYNSYQLFPGIRELLTKLQEQEFELYVWTARDRFSTLEILKSVNALHFFLDLKTSTDTPVKPHLSGLKAMVGEMNPKDVIVIGDSYTDILGAKNFGAKSIGATWCPNSQPQILTEMGAWALANTPQDCYNLLLDWATN
jgi:phosphoglycolate phosphatase